MKRRIRRRTFLKDAAAGTAALGLSPLAWASQPSQPSGSAPASAPGASPDEGPGRIPVRTLGKTGAKVSILGVGGYHLGSIQDEQTAIRLVRTALDEGVNFLDNAWEYHQGESERRMGKALKEGYRDKAFLMTKIHGRTAARAKEQLDESLKRLGVDHVDLLQIHEVIYEDDPARAFADDGMMQVLLEAKKAGKTRFIGFTGHKQPALHLEMLKRSDAWDAVQMPVNAFDPHVHSFVRHVLPVLRERNVGVIGMKSLASGHLLRAGVMTAEEGLRYVWSQPVDTVVSGMTTLDVLRTNMALARDFEPMDQKAQAALLDRTFDPSRKGEYEPYKTTTAFDGGFGQRLHQPG